MVCCEQNKKAIETVIQAFAVGASAAFVDLDDINHLTYDSCTMLVIDHELVCKIKDHRIDEYIKHIPVFIFYNGRLYDIHNIDALINDREQLLYDQQWDKAKEVNEVLCDVDYLFKNDVNLSYPSFFQLESTDYCNGKCIMCDHFFNKNQGASSLSMEKLDHFRDAIQLSRIVNLNGMGEPFIGKNIKDQIKVYTGYGNKIVANTNLSFLDDDLIELIKSSFDWLAISIDGATKETYESIRVNLSYDKLISNLYRLKENVPDIFLIFSMVIMRQNVCEMPDLVKLAYDVGVNQVVFLNLNPSIIIGNQNDVMTNYPKAFEYYSVKAIEIGEKLGIRVVVANASSLNRSISLEDITDDLEKMNSNPMWKTPEDEIRMSETYHFVKEYVEMHSQLQSTTVPSKVRCAGVCDWLLTNCYADQYGNVSMCCRNTIYRAGTITKEGEFQDVWNSSLMRKTREIFYSGYIPESCLGCGMIEGGELKYLSVDICPEFYEDGEIKRNQKRVYQELMGNK